MRLPAARLFSCVLSFDLVIPCLGLCCCVSSRLLQTAAALLLLCSAARKFCF